MKMAKLSFIQSDLEYELNKVKEINERMEHLKMTKEKRLRKINEKRRELNENVARE